MENEKESEWQIKANPERQVVPNGRHRAVLKDVIAVEVPTFKDKSVKEQKILFIFDPIDIELEDGKEASITKFVYPTMGEGGNMYKLLAAMSETGTVPSSATKDQKSFKEYTKSFIGKTFVVTSEVSKNGKYNNLVGVYPESSSSKKKGTTLENDDIPF